MNEKLTYLLVNLFTILFPFIFSFDKNIKFYRKWKYAFPAIIITGIFFIIWDNIFTSLGVWHFNENYIIGIRILKLPFEEILFFITVPYASLFVYEAVRFYFPTGLPVKLSRFILFGILGFVLVLACSNYGKLYTFFVSIFLVAGIVVILNFLKYISLGYIIISYSLLLFPFFIVNGILTGSFLQRSVVLYNNYENLGIRILTIPVEDAIYSLLMLILNVIIYEKIQLNQKSSESDLSNSFD